MVESLVGCLHWRCGCGTFNPVEERFCLSCGESVGNVENQRTWELTAWKCDGCGLEWWSSDQALRCPRCCSALIIGIGHEEGNGVYLLESDLVGPTMWAREGRRGTIDLWHCNTCDQRNSMSSDMCCICAQPRPEHPRTSFIIASEKDINIGG